MCAMDNDGTIAQAGVSHIMENLRGSFATGKTVPMHEPGSTSDILG